jgi:hypothetical protein
LHSVQYTHTDLEIGFCKNVSTCKITEKIHRQRYRHICAVDKCPDTSDPIHVKLNIHECKFGKKCKIDYKVNDMHFKNFIHSCHYTFSECRFCQRNDIPHQIYYSHVIETKVDNKIDWPTHWQNPSPPKITSFKGNHYQLVTLSSSSAEYQSTEKQFRVTMPNNTIRSIQRVEDYNLWMNFVVLERELSKINPTRQLFHGTDSSTIQSVTKNGFDCRFGNLSGKFGAGTYFSPNANYSHGYAKGSGQMFLARVAIGDTITLTTMTSGARTAPINTSTKKPYDTIFYAGVEVIVYENYQAYPEYIISYQ